MKKVFMVCLGLLLAGGLALADVTADRAPAAGARIEMKKEADLTAGTPVAGKAAGGPDAYGFRYIDSDEPGGPVFSWIDITSTGTALNLADDGEATITSSFPITFYGVSSTNFRVGNNGAVLFDTTAGDVTLSNYALPNANYGRKSFLVFQDDIDADSGNVYWQELGTAPNRMLVIEWFNRPHYSNTGAATFEMILYEGKEEVLFQYLDTDFGNASVNHGISATVGIQGDTLAATNWFLQYSYLTASLHNNLAIRFYHYVPQAGDLALQSIDEPSAPFIEPGLPFTPAATVGNPGTTPVSNFRVIYSISDQSKALVYEDTVNVAGPLDPGDTVQVTFDNFTPQSFTEYDITAYVSAAGDPYAANDTLHAFFRTWDLDVGTAAILAPTGTINPGSPVDPQATFHNYGQQEANFNAYFEIYEGANQIYGESVTINGLAPGADTTVTFPNWAALHNLGWHTAKAYTTMNYDLDPSNDTLALDFNVSNAIWDQYAGTGTACASQNFEATYDQYDCWIADDFSVGWVDSALVDSISIGGGYWNGAGPADSLFFAICTDSSGMPSFDQIIWRANITVFSDSAGNMEARLPAPCMLQPGNYWLIYQAYMNYATGGQYGWRHRAPKAPIGSQGYFLNPGGGFGVGTGWVTASTAGWGNVDFRFALWGETFLTGVAGGQSGATRASFALLPNYPNPVKGRTTLSFSLPKAGAYEVTLYNVAGQAVDRLTGQGRAGDNSISWNAAGVGAGVYFYQLNAGGQSATGKLVVVK